MRCSRWPRCASLGSSRRSPSTRRHRSSSWLRALARNLHQEVGGPGVGAVGMCFSGGFALGMMVDDIMLAPVLSQPSMPLPIGKRAAPISTCRPTMRRRSPSGQQRVARCSACDSPTTSWSAIASPRFVSCSATRSSPIELPSSQVDGPFRAHRATRRGQRANVSSTSSSRNFRPDDPPHRSREQLREQSGELFTRSVRWRRRRAPWRRGSRLCRSGREGPDRRRSPTWGP